MQIVLQFLTQYVRLAQYFNAALPFLFKIFIFIFKIAVIEWFNRRVWERGRVNHPIAKHKPNECSTLRWEIDKNFALSIIYVIHNSHIPKAKNEFGHQKIFHSVLAIQWFQWNQSIEVQFIKHFFLSIQI